MKRLSVWLWWVLVVSASGDEPKTAREFAQRGMQHFRAAEIKESINDFEKAAKLAPQAKAQLWQLGISYYYAGEFKKGRELFELHQTVNPEDVENAVWHFLCVAKLEGVDSARKRFIAITDDRRVPMKEVHQLFAGKGEEQAVLKAAKGQKEHLFYAHLYLGLYEEALGHKEESLKHMKLAAQDFPQSHYMGDVAKVHLKLREREGNTKSQIPNAKE
jgi:tetratricopeptide (TPR) repeat protein